MKKLVSSIFIFALVLFVVPSQTYAAWWNPISWFSSENQIEEQNQPQNVTSSDTTSKSQIAESSDTTKIIPVKPESALNINNQSTEIESLKADIVLLTNGMSELLKAHNNLVNRHNALSKSVNATILSNNGNSSGTADNSNLETRVTSLEKKLNDACAQIFSSLGGLSSNKCPSSSPFSTGGTLESRIKKLESGF